MGPLRESVGFGWIHLDLSIAYDHAKILNFPLFKLAFLGLEVQI
jgi:hypothetical protein